MTSDWDLLEAARAGDESAWQELFQRHYQALVKMICLITGSLETGKDLAQETFIRLLKSRTGHRQGNLKAYLTTIAYRLAVKESVRRRRLRDLEGMELADPDPISSDNTLQQELNRHLLQVINSVQDIHREILVLRFYGDHSYEEIAQMTGLPLGTVKSRLFYAVQECREKLRQRGVI